MKFVHAITLGSLFAASIACQPKDNFFKIQTRGNAIGYLNGPKFTLNLANNLFVLKLVAVAPTTSLSGISDPAQQNATAGSQNATVTVGSGNFISAEGSNFLLTSFSGATAVDVAAFSNVYRLSRLGGPQLPLVPAANATFTLTDFFPGPLQAMAGLRYPATKTPISNADLKKPNRATGLWAGIYALLSATSQGPGMSITLFSAPGNAGAKILEDARYSSIVKELLPDNGSGPRQIYMRNKDVKPGDLLMVYAPTKAPNGSTSGTEFVHMAMMLDHDVYLEQIETNNGYAFRVCRFEDVLFNLAQNYNADVNELKYFFRRPLVAQLPAPKTTFAAAGAKFWGDVTLAPEAATGRFRVTQTTVKLNPLTFEVLSEKPAQ